MKQGRYCALALGCALLLTGCESWRRLPSPDAPKEVTAASIWQQEEEQPDGQQEQDAGGLAVEQSTATDMLSASITAGARRNRPGAAATRCFPTSSTAC